MPERQRISNETYQAMIETLESCVDRGVLRQTPQAIVDHMIAQGDLEVDKPAEVKIAEAGEALIHGITAFLTGPCVPKERRLELLRRASALEDAFNEARKAASAE
jgi:hypothetical protein